MLATAAQGVKNSDLGMGREKLRNFLDDETKILEIKNSIPEYFHGIIDDEINCVEDVDEIENSDNNDNNHNNDNNDVLVLVGSTDDMHSISSVKGDEESIVSLEIKEEKIVTPPLVTEVPLKFIREIVGWKKEKITVKSSDENENEKEKKNEDKNKNIDEDICIDELSAVTKFLMLKTSLILRREILKNTEEIKNSSPVFPVFTPTLCLDRLCCEGIATLHGWYTVRSERTDIVSSLFNVHVLYGVMPPNKKAGIDALECTTKSLHGNRRGNATNKSPTQAIDENENENENNGINRDILRYCPTSELLVLQSGLSLHVYDTIRKTRKLITLQGKNLDRVISYCGLNKSKFNVTELGCKVLLNATHLLRTIWSTENGRNSFVDVELNFSERTRYDLGVESGPESTVESVQPISPADKVLTKAKQKEINGSLKSKQTVLSVLPPTIPGSGRGISSGKQKRKQNNVHTVCDGKSNTIVNPRLQKLAAARAFMQRTAAAVI